jgi:hypothetical protein
MTGSWMRLPLGPPRTSRRQHRCADQIAYVNVDDMQTYGYAKQGVGYGYTGAKGLNALLSTVSTPPAAPIIVRRHSAGDRPPGFSFLSRRDHRRDPPRPAPLLHHRM